MDKSLMVVGDVELPGIPVFKKGKVRNVFDLGDRLLIIATDRISAFDFVLPSLIPYKGQVLTQLSRFWFDYTFLVCRNHMIS
ncbi:MAG TPA: phosphoribosylaminoimidazolesuccinocarboxamide synthase, partial [Candidatus Saccharicenans sp.]|nr:phosphoribosylaminoimidazolesuccinocarboxamide synthase [Candidatus Saccharicenans sp.]